MFPWSASVILLLFVQQSLASHKCAIIIMDEGAEDMEVVVTADLLRRAGVNVTLAGFSGAAPVKCAHKTVITPDKTFDEVANVTHDLIVIPGGLLTEKLAESEKVGKALEAQHAAGGWIAAICGGPKVLAAHKIEPGCRVTSHPAAKETMEAAGYLYSEDRVVVDKKIVTSRAPGTTFEFGLKLVEVLVSKEEADKLRASLHFYL